MVKVPKSFHQNFFTHQPNTAFISRAAPRAVMGAAMNAARRLDLKMQVPIISVVLVLVRVL